MRREIDISHEEYQLFDGRHRNLEYRVRVIYNHPNVEAMTRNDPEIVATLAAFCTLRANCDS